MSELESCATPVQDRTFPKLLIGIFARAGICTIEVLQWTRKRRHVVFRTNGCAASTTTGIFY